VRQVDNIKDGVFDIAIDKGTLDAMITRSSWDPLSRGKKNTRKYVDEVSCRQSVILERYHYILSNSLRLKASIGQVSASLRPVQ